MLGVKKPTLFFVNSMSDMFHRDIPDQFIADAFNAFWRHPQHTFQILTKRPERMRRLVNRIWTGEFRPHPGDKPLYVPQNIWLGVSIESSDYAWRADMLRETPAAVRFLSLEPLLGPIAPEVIHGMDWVIVGGESGPGHRPMDLEWARELRAYAGGGAGIPFFFKQVSAQRPTDDMIPADLRIREWPQVAT
jgi:protein gp37